MSDHVHIDSRTFLNQTLSLAFTESNSLGKLPLNTYKHVQEAVQSIRRIQSGLDQAQQALDDLRDFLEEVLEDDSVF